MTREQMYEFAEEYFLQGLRLSRMKNADYAGEGDPFENFRQCGEIGFVTRMTDKMTRMKNLAFRELADGGGPAVDESFEDTLMDLFNYCWLMAAYRHSTRHGAMAAFPLKPFPVEDFEGIPACLCKKSTCLVCFPRRTE